MTLLWYKENGKWKNQTENKVWKHNGKWGEFPTYFKSNSKWHLISSEGKEINWDAAILSGITTPEDLKKLIEATGSGSSVVSDFFLTTNPARFATSEGFPAYSKEGLGDSTDARAAPLDMAKALAKKGAPYTIGYIKKPSYIKLSFKYYNRNSSTQPIGTKSAYVSFTATNNKNAVYFPIIVKDERTASGTEGEVFIDNGNVSYTKIASNSNVITTVEITDVPNQLPSCFLDGNTYNVSFHESNVLLSGAGVYAQQKMYLHEFIVK